MCLPRETKIQKLTRPTSERIGKIALKLKQIDQLVGILDEYLQKAKTGPAPKSYTQLSSGSIRVGAYLLLGHVERLDRDIKDLSPTVAEEKEIALLQSITNDLTKMRETIKTDLSPGGKYHHHKKPAGNDAVVIPGLTVAFAAAAYIQKNTNFRVIVVANKYSDFLSRSGAVGIYAIKKFFFHLGLHYGLNDAKLVPVLKSRPNTSLGIKHLDMLGMAVLLAEGGEIVKGEFKWGNVKNIPGSEFPTLYVPSDREKDKIEMIPNVRCVINAMGANALFPEDIKRMPLSRGDEKRQLHRNHCIQTFFQTTPEFMERIYKLSHKEFAKKYYWLQFFGTDPKRGKCESYAIISENENKVLDAKASELLPSLIPESKNEAQINELKILLKMRLFIEFLMDINEEKTEDNSIPAFKLRDNIKSGKPLATEFKLPQPTMLPQVIKRIGDTKAITVAIGGAALTPLLDGTLLPSSLDHMQETIMHLMRINFTLGSDNEKAIQCGSYNQWIAHVNSYIDNYPHIDRAIDMETFFNKKYPKM